jgi:hypothetical protein
VQDFLFYIEFRQALGPQPPIQWVPGLKRQVYEADHSSPFIAEIKNIMSHTSTPPCLHGTMRNQLSTDKFTFYGWGGWAYWRDITINLTFFTVIKVEKWQSPYCDAISFD